MATDIDSLKAEIARMERQLELAKRELSQLERANGGGGEAELPLNTMRGILKGRVEFSDADIESVKIRSRSLK